MILGTSFFVGCEATQAIQARKVPLWDQEAIQARKVPLWDQEAIQARQVPLWDQEAHKVLVSGSRGLPRPRQIGHCQIGHC